MSSCPFPTSWSDVRSILVEAAGQPNEGIHKYRIGPFALVDTLATIVVAAALFYYFAPKCWGIGRMVLFVLCILLLTIPIHMLLGVDTAAVKMVRQWWNTNPTPTSMLHSAASRLSSARLGSSTPSDATTQVAGSGQDIDSYPLDADFWRAAPVDESNQDFSDI